jgi:glutamate racemase
VARHLGEVLAHRGLRQRQRQPCHRFFTTGDPYGFDQAAQRLVGVMAASQALRWQLEGSTGLALQPL